MALTTEIGLVKTEIASSIGASLYNAKDLVYVSKAIEALANAESAGGSFAIAYVDNILYVGSAASAFESAAALTNPIAVFQIAANDFAQIAFKNTSSHVDASTDFIAYTNNGSDTDGYIDMGITSSNFADEEFTITGKGDGYIFMVGAAGGTDQGNLVFATGDTGSQNKIIFAAGGLASDNTQMSITPDENVHIEIDTPSTSPTTGALTVVGGVGITGDINIAGSLTFGGESSSLETTTLAVADPLIFVGSNNRTDSVDLGLIAEYATTVSTITKAISNKALTSNVATLTTSTTHGFAVGDIVVVGSVDATFNGTHVVKAVPTTTTFTYDKTNANVTSAAVSPAGTAEVTTTRRFAGVIRDASDGVVKFFKDATTKPSSVVNLSEAGASYANILVGAAEIGSVSNTEIQYLDGVTSSIQTQLNAKANLADPTFTGNVVLPSTTVIGDVDATEIGYLNGVSSNVQTQLDAKLASSTASSTYAALSGASFTGNVQLQEVSETVVDVTLASNVATLDWASGNIYYIATAPSAAMTFNVTNVPTTVSKIMTINVFVTQGATGRIPTTFQINSSTISAPSFKWSNGTTPTPTSSAGKIDIFSFTMQRTSGGAWLVYGAVSANF
jgi:hypothetical protein